MAANGLDRAIVALGRSAAAAPEFYRRLAQGDLWFLIHYHPEVENSVMELKNGAPLPFVRLKDADGAVVPLFSSQARADEGLNKARVPPRTFSLGSLPAKVVLEVLGKAELRAVVNKNCATGEVIIPPNLMRELANGKALKPLGLGGKRAKPLAVTILDPADYPTYLIQPVFELMRQHRNFRAAWVFGPPADMAQPGKARVYYLMLLMEPRDEVLFHDFNMVVQAARGEACEVEMGVAEETNPEYVANLFRQAKPFYVAADYRPPSAAAA